MKAGIGVRTDPNTPLPAFLLFTIHSMHLRGTKPMYPRVSTFPTAAKVVLASFALAIVVFLPGCPSDQIAQNFVKGKVTVDGKAASTGSVIFTSADKKEATALISPDGSYMVTNPPVGKVVITLKGSGLAAQKFEVPTKDKMPTGPSKDLLSKASTIIEPPAKYALPDNGINYEVKPGRQEFDLKLSS